MKKLLLITGTFLFFSTSNYGQIDSFRAKSIKLNLQQHYYQKGKNQQKVGFILLGSGIALDLISIAVYPKNYSYDPFWGGNSPKADKQAAISGVLFLIGTSALISSIPVLISGAVNRHHARLMVKTEQVELSPKIKTSQWQLKTGIAINF